MIQSINMKEIKFRPIGDQILIKPDDVETKTKSGLIISEDSAEKPKSGVVVKLGTADGMVLMDGKPFKFAVKVGDKVYWGYQGREIEIDGVNYLIMKEMELLGFEEK